MGVLKIKPKEQCKYDCISLGEIMLRFDPGEGRIRNTREFRVWEGGGEYNVTRGLRKCFKMSCGVVTALAENDVGLLLEDLILQGGVDTSLIQWIPYDGIGKSVRNGLNFTERGYGLRGAVGISDRANTATSQMKKGDIDWEYIFNMLGARWFHTGGIFAALSDTTPDVVLEAVRVAKKYGTIVSYDLNYRPSLWNYVGGKARAQAVNKELAKHIDVMIGNEEDFTACLGFDVQGNDDHLKKLNIDGYKQMIDEVVKVYPNLQLVATTLRTVRTATVNDWRAICWAGGQIFKSNDYKALEILDRVGGGDSFASGLIYGLMSTGDPEQAVQYGAAHGALAMTTPGDTSMVSLKEVESVVKGSGARIVR